MGEMGTSLREVIRTEALPKPDKTAATGPVFLGICNEPRIFLQDIWADFWIKKKDSRDQSHVLGIYSRPEVF